MTTGGGSWWSSVGNWLANNPQIVAAGVGAAGAYFGDRAENAAAEEAAAGAQFNPYNVTGPGGRATFDGNQANVALSPEMQAYSDSLGARAEGLFSNPTNGASRRATHAGNRAFAELGDFDPLAAAEGQFNKLESILEPGRDKARAGLESRLFSQGRLDSTGGAAQMGEFEAAIEQERQRNLYNSWDQAQATQTSMINNATGLSQFGFNMEGGLFDRGLQSVDAQRQLHADALRLMEMGGQLGGMQANAGANAGDRFTYRSGRNRADRISGLFGGVADGIRG